MITNKEFIEVACRYESAVDQLDTIMQDMVGMVIYYPYHRFTSEDVDKDLMVVGVLDKYYYDHDDLVPYLRFVYINHETYKKDTRYLDWDDIRKEARW